MRLYFSGGLCSEKKDPYLVSIIKNRLLSYHYISPKLVQYYWDLKKQNGMRLMLDSGAFSVWNRGEKVDFESYLKYCLETQDQWDVIIVLDQIPGSPGKKDVSVEERDHCATISWERYCKMIQAGIPAEKLMPVYHQGEDPKWIKQMVTYCPLVGISPANDRTPHEKKVWLNDVMDVVCDDEGKAKTRIHGLAVTSPVLMRDYPWDSVDSATWVILTGNGGCMLPRYCGPGKMDFFDYIILHCGKNGNRPDHFDAMSPEIQKMILSCLREAGLIDNTVESIGDDRVMRMRINTWYFCELENRLNAMDVRWRRKPQQEDLGLHLESF